MKLKNDVFEWLAKNQLGWEKAYLESVGHTIVNTLADVLWYVGWYVGCGVPVCFDSFQGYNRPEEQRKRKREEANLKASDLLCYP